MRFPFITSITYENSDECEVFYISKCLFWNAFKKLPAKVSAKMLVLVWWRVCGGCCTPESDCCSGITLSHRYLRRVTLGQPVLWASSIVTSAPQHWGSQCGSSLSSTHLSLLSHLSCYSALWSVTAIVSHHLILTTQTILRDHQTWETIVSLSLSWL